MLEHPLRRKRRKKLKTIYEPISIVTDISELYERGMYNQINALL